MTNPRRNKETPPPKPERVVPQNTTAEQAALACLLDQADLSVPLTESHFFTPANKIVFEVIKELTEKNQPVNIMTVRVMLEAKGLLDQAGGDPSRYFDFGGGGSREARLVTERDHYKQALEEISSSIEDWLNSLIQEPSLDFIHAIKAYAQKKLNEI